MRFSLVAGLILIVAGVLVLLQGGNVTTRRDVLDVGGLKVVASESHPVAPWLAGTALIAGVVLLAMGARPAGSRPRF